MLVKHLQSYIYKELRLRVTLLVTMAAILIFLSIYNQSSLNEQDKVEKESKKLQNDLSIVKKNISDSESSLKLWDNGIKGILKDRSGIKIKPASKILDQLKTTYKIKELVISLSNPEERNDVAATKFTKVVFTNGSMTFKAYNDIYAYRFIDSFVKELPGFIQIKSFAITAEPSTDYINDITTGKLDTLTKAKVDFIWQDLQDVKTDADKNAASNTNTGNANDAKKTLLLNSPDRK